MPVEVKPLFRPDVLRPHLAAFPKPAVDRAPLQHWAGEISSGRINRFGEQEILPHSLADFFIGLLGYTGRAGRDRYTRIRVLGALTGAAIDRVPLVLDQFQCC